VRVNTARILILPYPLHPPPSISGHCLVEAPSGAAVLRLIFELGAEAERAHLHRRGLAILEQALTRRTQSHHICAD